MAKDQKGKTNYDIGYRKPPEHSRFQPGTSGNPGGRKKSRSNVRTELEEVLSREMEVNHNGKKQIVTIKTALILRMVQEGLKGNDRAIEKLLDRAERYEDAATHDEEELLEDDVELIDRAVARRSQKPQPPKREGGPDKGGARKAKDSGRDV